MNRKLIATLAAFLIAGPAVAAAPPIPPPAPLPTGTSGHVIPFLDGVNTFSAVQQINLNAATAPAPSASTTFQLSAANESFNRLQMYAFGTAPNAGLLSIRARGTAASPTAVQSGDVLSIVGGAGYGATAYSGAKGVWTIKATENFTDTAQGTRGYFQGTTTGVLSNYFVNMPQLAAGITDTLVGQNTVDTLTNKTLTAAVRTGYTVATLPASPGTGAMAYVSDAIACTFLATLTGGGSTYCPVGYNGVSWVAE